MRPPLPKPKPVEIMRPSLDEPAAIVAPEPETNETQSRTTTGVTAFVIPREKPVELKKPEPEPLPGSRPEPDDTQAGDR